MANAITIVKQRDDVQVILHNGTILSSAVGTTIEKFFDYARQANLLPDVDTTIVAAIANGKLRELSYRIKHDTEITPVTMRQSDGSRIYRRSLVLLLTTAVGELWESANVSVRYAVRDGGFFCQILHRDPLTDSEIKQLNKRMREIVAADEPITKYVVPIDEAQQLFAKRGDDDKVRLLDYRSHDFLNLYNLRGRDDYYFGYMVTSTKYLDLWKLINVDGGFILQYPRSENPTELKELHLYEKLSRVFQQADDWLEKLNMEDVGQLNQQIEEDKIQEFILVAEALHEQQVANIATQIAIKHHNGARIVLIAGPTSSGKTTFSKRLAIQLLAQGLRPVTIEMDHYFVDRDKTPLDTDGNFDFEHINALNTALLNDNLMRLMGGELVQLPKFNFHLGQSEIGEELQVSDNQIIILEGIHGLNPALVENIPDENIFRVYVSVMSQLNIDLHNRVPTTDVRLMRRIIRDARSRGYDAQATLERWRSVRRGEKRNIFPYQENADVMFNSALVYELAALRPLVEPLLLQVAPNTLEHIEANRLLSFLRWVQPLKLHQADMIPDTSLLREFIGGSILESYIPK